MPVNDAERAKMQRIARDLVAGQTDDRGTPEQRAEVLALINEGRRRARTAPLDDRAPEEGLYDRAKSLGMARIDR